MSAQAFARIGDLASPEVAPSASERRDRGTGGPVRATVPLTSLRRDASGIVAGVRVGAPGTSPDKLDPADERMALRLMEIGFVEGASLRVIAFGQPGDDPIGVRVGGRGGVSTFALRRAEAACVWVWPDARP